MFLNNLHFLSWVSSPLTWLIALFGLVLGSFLNVCIFRIPEKTFFSNKRSFCRHCKKNIPFYWNLPLISFLLLRGKTRCCGKPLSWQYPIVEGLTAVMVLFLSVRLPFWSLVGEQFSIHPEMAIRFFHALLFGSLILVCSVIDLRLMIIPDLISLPMIALSPLIAWFHPDLDLKSSLIGVAAGGLSLYLVAWAYWLIRREIGLGMGDVKLLAAIGGWLGYQSILPTLFIGSILGAVLGVSALLFSKKFSLKSALPFGPFLGFGALFHLLSENFIQELFYFWSRGMG